MRLHGSAWEVHGSARERMRLHGCECMCMHRADESTRWIRIVGKLIKIQ